MPSDALNSLSTFNSIAGTLRWVIPILNILSKMHESIDYFRACSDPTDAMRLLNKLSKLLKDEKI